jgi:hypothetical protein
MARFYCNENFPLPAVVELRKLGHRCVTVAESGKANVQMADEAVLEFATTNGLAVITFNRRHFIALHVRKPDYAGIVVCTTDADFPALARRIDKAVDPFGDDLRGKLVRVTRAN